MTDPYTRAAEAMHADLLLSASTTPTAMRGSLARANLAIIDAGELERMRDKIEELVDAGEHDHAPQ